MGLHPLLGEPRRFAPFFLAVIVTAWYAGPQINLTVGNHFSFNVAADLPLRVANRGLQTVIDYRIHGGLTWSF